MIDKFKELVENSVQEEEILDFLDALSDKERRSLVPMVRVRVKNFMDYRKVDEPWHRYFFLIAYYGMSKNDFRKYIRFLPSDFYKDNIAYHFVPTWFSDFVNEFNAIPDYLTLMDYTEKGYLTPTKELIVNKLDATIWQTVYAKASIYAPEKLLKYEITLKEHIWLLFREDNNINNQDRYLDYPNKDTRAWLLTLKNLVAEKKLDRREVLKESILASTRNFNMQLTGWFFTLIDGLKPTKEEILSLQDEFFLTFSAPQSRPINDSLKYLKTVCEHKDFKTDTFLELVPSILSSDVKSVINKALTILEKLAKKHTELQSKITLISVQGLLFQDEKIQTQIAKIILNHGDKSGGDKSDALQDEIGMYYNELHSSVKILLEAYAVESEALEASFKVEYFSYISDVNKIESYENFDEMVFFFSQVFENNEDHHFDLFMALLPKLDRQMTATNIQKLEPAFQRAIKTTNTSSNKIGKIENLMALTFVEYMQRNFNSFPSETMKMKKFYEKTLKEDEELSVWHKSICSLKGSILAHQSRIYFLYVALLENLLSSIEEKRSLAFLSMPTHVPCFIAFEVFIARIKEHQTQEVVLQSLDFQIALARLVLENRTEHKALIERELTGEPRDLLLYLVDENQSLNFSLCQNNALWLVAILLKGFKEDLINFLKQFPQEKEDGILFVAPKWSVKADEKYNEWIRLKIEKAKVHSSALGTFYNYFEIGSDYAEQDHKKILHLSPFRVEPLLRVLTEKQMDSTSFEDAYEIRSTYYILERLFLLWNNEMQEDAYLYLSCCLLFVKKTTRQLATELWIEKTAKGEMNNALLGATLGKLETLEYAPLKRLTELMTSQMINLSKQHNKALEELLSSILVAMGDEPIKGTKKLLEIYLEVLVLNGSVANSMVCTKFEDWVEVKSLKGVMGKIIKLSV